ncbi:MAG: Rho-type gtpase-activating protein [Geoglossum umbratile]|nr:MAG: Rho-type gtpase-activating protein [Geoglossum umbratile]
MEPEDVYPCKGCGEILEEGKAFELAGNRWHIDCFRCNTCGTLLDSDANLLLLGDGSLICNNCTYSCNACGNKIEDLAILTGDQAFCASCFRCRNCKRKIENLRYARTSQGIFCMSCHETLMARRRKKSRAAAHQQKLASNSQSPILLDKSLPSLPPNALPPTSAPSPDHESTPSETTSETPTELSPRPRTTNMRLDPARSLNRDPSPNVESTRDNLLLSPVTYQNNVIASKRTQDLKSPPEASPTDDPSEPFSFIPLAFDPSPAPGPPPMALSRETNNADGRDHSHKQLKPGSVSHSHEKRAPSPASLLRDQEGRPGSGGGSLHTSDKGGQLSEAAGNPGNKERARRDVSATSTPNSVHSSPLPRKENNRLQHTNISNGRNGVAENKDLFRLQEVPRSKKSGGSPRSSRSRNESPEPSSSLGPMRSSSLQASATSGEEQVDPPRNESPPLQPLRMNKTTPRASQDTGRRDDQSSHSTHSATPSISPQLLQKPKREDSLVQQHVIPRSEEEVAPPTVIHKAPSRHETSPSTSSHTTPDSLSSTTQANGHTPQKTPTDSPRSSSIEKITPAVPPRKPAPTVNGVSTADSFSSPRAPPPPPSATQSIHQELSPTGSTQYGEPSPSSDIITALPQCTTGGDLSMDDDLVRILGGNIETSPASLLRRISGVQHGRSFSDNVTRTGNSPRWSRSTTNGGASIHGHELSSTSTTPDAKEENSILKHQLRRSAQRIAELEARIGSNVDIKKLDTNIREKRSTVAFLDSQKEIMVRELEVLTERVAEAKKSGRPLHIESLKSDVVRDFAMSLQQLKAVYQPEIEDLIHQKNQLIEENTNLARLRDQAIQETEQLNLKNAQLADLNNELTQQIQQRYRANREQSITQTVESPRPTNGLGIYNHHKERSEVSIDGKELRPPMGVSTSGSSTSLHGDHSDDHGTVHSTPHIVNIRQPKKSSYWKKGSQTVAKNVSKGLKGAFSSGNQYQREGSITDIGVPYATTVASDPPSVNTPRSTVDPSRQFGIFGAQKFSKGMQGKPSLNGNLPVAAESPSTLFGSALEQRADYEKRQIPNVVTRCIEEVELRGMDLEGIYRKVGGNSQVKAIQEGFEKNEDFDISDPSLDISAVTSVLKQYFRKLPTPLLTFDVYDKILESNSFTDDNKRAMFLRTTVGQLPPSHRGCLEFLVFHLARVAQREKENLMSPKNLAVVFAPTIMRDHSLEREMTDMHSKNTAIQFLIENNKVIFGGF